MRNPLRQVARRWRQRRFRIRPRTPDAPPVGEGATPQPMASPTPPVAEPTPPQPVAPAPNAANAETVAALAQPVLDRLAEDEALRGDLTDAGFTPLLDWLSRLTTDAASRAAAAPDPEATMEQVADTALRLGRAIVRAAERADASGLADALVPPLVTPGMAARAAAALPPLAPDATPDERTQVLVAALSAATST
jgi:hypothetical protein